MAMNRNELALFLDWASRSEAVLENLGSRGSRYDRNLVSGFQAWYNHVLSPLQSTLISGGLDPGAVSRMVPLVVDSTWGPNTAAVASIPLRPEIPASGAPARAADVPTWWQTHRGVVSRKVTHLENQLAAVDTRLAEQAQATVVPGDPPAEILPPPATPAPEPEQNVVRDLIDPDTGAPIEFAVPGRTVRDTPPVAKSTSWLAVLLAMGVLGVGGFLFYKAVKSRRGPQKSASKRRPAQLRARNA